MKKLLLLTLSLISVGFLTGCGAENTFQQSCNFVQNSSLQRVSWKYDLPVKLYVHESVPADHIEVYEAAAKQWKKKLGVEVIKIIPGRVGGAKEARQDGHSIIYYNAEWDPSRPTEQARTTAYWTGSKIFEADVSVNAQFSFFTQSSDTQRYSKIHLESLMVHEFGHVLGLAHNDSQGSVMHETLAKGKMRELPGAIDINSFSCEYDHI